MHNPASARASILLACAQKNEHPFLWDVKRHINLFAKVPATDWTAHINGDENDRITARVYGRISLTVTLLPNGKKPGTHFVRTLSILGANPYDYENGRADISELNLAIETEPFDPQDLVSLLGSLTVIGHEDLDAISFPSPPQDRFTAISRIGEQMLLKTYPEFCEENGEDQSRSFSIWLAESHKWIASSRKLMTEPIIQELPDFPNPVPSMMGIYRPKYHDPKYPIIASLMAPSFQLTSGSYDVIAAMNAANAMAAFTSTYDAGSHS
ncbi:MAG: hypothetical protein CL472_09245 [Acidobacteria bacterium]|nr:hypothetical protein [Acidobacteriota bacterium]